MLIRLSDPDRERLGVEEEWITSNLGGGITVNEAIVIQHEAGYRRGPDGLREAWSAQVVHDAAGKPVDVVLDARAWKATVWLALRRLGKRIPYADFDFDLTGLDYKSEPTSEGEDDDSGKDPSTPGPTSATASPSTPP